MPTYINSLLIPFLYLTHILINPLQFLPFDYTLGTIYTLHAIFIDPMRLWDVVGNQITWRKSMQSNGKHANSHS